MIEKPSWRGDDHVHAAAKGMVGTRNIGFPRLTAFSYWVYLFGSLFMNSSWLIGAAPNGGWFGYAPLTTMPYSPGVNIDFWMLGLQILGVSSLAAAFNFITTIINMRAPGMNLMRMPMFTWNAFVVQFLVLLAFPVITVALILLMGFLKPHSEKIYSLLRIIAGLLFMSGQPR